MKTKLLRKMHRRFDWYFNSDGDIVLLNKSNKSVFVMDDESLKKYYKLDTLDASCGKEEFKARLIRGYILKNIGMSEDLFLFRRATRAFNRRLPKNPIK